MNNEAKSHLANKEFAQALGHVQEIISKYPYDSASLARAGSWSLVMSGPEEAIYYLLKAWVMKPKDPRIPFNLARAYYLRGQTTQALDFLEIAVRNGFNDKSEIEKSKMFQGLNKNERFRQLMNLLITANEKQDFLRSATAKK
jgi:Flp pilus assembly protein TadD